MAIDTTTSVDVQTLTPFKKFIMTIGALPTSYLESMTYAELLMWFCNYLQETVIPTVNNNAEAVEELQGLYEELKNYVNDYFDNLDVQNEINIKLDQMAVDGSLTNLIKAYIEPKIEQQNQVINTLQNNVNSQIAELNEEVQAVTSGSPLVASSTSGMTDTSRVYVNTSDGKWYYYDGDSWEIGGTYQSTGIGEGTIGLENLKNEVINDRYSNGIINNLNPFNCMSNTSISDVGDIFSNNDYWLSGKINVTGGQTILIERTLNSNYDSMTESLWCYKYVLFNSSDEVVLTERNKRKITVANDGYVYIQFPNAGVPFSTRFNVMIRSVDSATADLDSSYLRPFKPYTTTNNFNVNKNIDVYNLNQYLQKNINVLPNFEFRLGSILGATGRDDTASQNRICTKNSQYITKNTVITSTDDIDFTILYYNDDFSYNRTTGWLSGSYTIENNSLIRIVIRNHDNSNIAQEDISTLVGKLNIVNNIDNIYNILVQNNIASGNAYLNYSGNKINLFENKLFYSRQDFSTLYQDSCEYNGKVFIFNNQGQFNVFDLTTNTQLGLFELDEYSTIKPHCNAVFFGTEKYAVGDLFPILYVNAYNTSGLPLGTLYAHRVMYNSETSTYTTQLLQTIRIGFTDNEIWTVPGDDRPYGNFILNTDTNELYAFTLRGDNTRFFKFNMPLLNAGSTVTLQQSDILDMFDLEFMPYIQGCCYSNNQILSLNGNNNSVANSSSLKVIDLLNKQVTNRVDLSSLMDEPESIFVYSNHMYIGGESYFYKFN